MQRMSQRLFAAIAAVLGLTGLASAQYAPPNPYPVVPPYQPIQPVQVIPYQPIQIPQPMPYQPIQPIQSVPAAQQPASTTVNPAPGAVALPGTIGCNTCGKGGPSVPSPYLPQGTARGVGLAPIPYNEYCAQCANGCGSLKSDLGFMFGSCKSFFNPCGPIPCGGGCAGKCGSFPFGKPYGSGYNGCTYDSYLQH